MLPARDVVPGIRRGRALWGRDDATARRAAARALAAVEAGIEVRDIRWSSAGARTPTPRRRRPPRRLLLPRHREPPLHRTPQRGRAARCGRRSEGTVDRIGRPPGAGCPGAGAV
ncbi:hypothetical protein FM103_04865 [Corynebacterium xerosis]|nr:hypothetical protein FM103_04865 [Corynebacterium xerosis]